MRIYTGMAVRPEVDARDNAACHRDAIPTDGIADGDHFCVKLRDTAEIERLELVKMLAVFCFNDRQVTIMRDVDDLRRMRLRIVRGADQNARGVADNMRIRQKAILADEEARAATAAGLPRIPRFAVIGKQHRYVDVHDAFPGA